MLCFLLPVIALYADVSGIGYGTTETAALDNARENLISSFSLNISSVTLTSSKDDGSGASQDSLQSMSMQSTSFNILGAVEKTEKQKDGTYKATTTIPSSAVALYENQLKVLYRDVESLVGQSEKTTDDDARKTIFLRLSSLLRQYEVYQTVVLTLDPSSSVGARIAPIGRASVESALSQILVKENNNADITILDLQQRAEYGILSLEGQAELDAALKTIEENRIMAEAIEKQKMADLELKREEFLAEMQLAVDSLQQNITNQSVMAEAAGEMSLSSVLNKIEANRETFMAVKNSMDESLATIEDAYDSEAAALSEEIMSRPYPAGDTYNGVPTQSAVENRRKLVEVELQTLWEPYSEKANAVYKEGFSKLCVIADYANDYIDLINGKIFTASSISPEVSTKIEYYVPSAELWSGIATVTLGNKSIDLYFKIPYEAWTGEKVPSSSSIAAYESYVDTTEDWTQLMNDYSQLFTITFSFSVEAKKDTSYEITFTKYSITRNDTGNVVFEEYINQKNSIDYDNNVSFDDFSVINDSLVDYSLFEYVRSSERSMDIEVTGIAGEVDEGESEYKATEQESRQTVVSGTKITFDNSGIAKIYGGVIWTPDCGSIPTSAEAGASMYISKIGIGKPGFDVIYATRQNFDFNGFIHFRINYLMSFFIKDAIGFYVSPHAGISLDLSVSQEEVTNNGAKDISYSGGASAGVLIPLSIGVLDLSAIINYSSSAGLTYGAGLGFSIYTW